MVEEGKNTHSPQVRAVALLRDKLSGHTSCAARARAGADGGVDARLLDDLGRSTSLAGGDSDTASGGSDVNALRKYKVNTNTLGPSRFVTHLLVGDTGVLERVKVRQVSLHARINPTTSVAMKAHIHSQPPSRRRDPQGPS